MNRFGTTLRFASALCMAVIAASAADAQSRFPTRPIRIVSPFAAGSVSDVSLRLLADKLVELEVADTVSHETVRQVLKKTSSSRT